MQKSNESIHSLISDSVNNQKLSLIIMITFYIVFLFALITQIQMFHRNERNTWTKLLEDQLQKSSVIGKKTIIPKHNDSYNILRVNRYGDIIDSSSNNLVGINIVNSGIFERINTMAIFDEVVFLEPGLIENRLMTYYVIRDVYYHTILISEPDTFFPLKSEETLFLILDNKGGVIYSTIKEFIGENFNTNFLNVKNGKLYIPNKIKLRFSSISNITILHDISMQVYILLAIAMITFVLLKYQSSNMKKYISKFRKYEAESLEVDNLAKDLSILDSLNYIGSDIQLMKYKEILLSFIYNGVSKDIVFQDNKKELRRYLDLAESVLTLLNKLSRIVANLQETKNRYQSIYENIQEGVFQSTTDGLIITANEPLVKLLQFNDMKWMIDYLTKNKQSIFANETDKSAFFKHFSEKNSVEHFETLLKSYNGEKIPVILSGRKVMNEQEDVLYIQGNVRDLTTEQKAKLLKEEKERAIAISQAKSAFLANISHELRTPLNSVIGFSELLAVNIKNEKLKSYTDSILTAGKSLLTLITDILDLSKIEAHKMEIKKTPVSLQSVLYEIMQIFNMKALRKNLELESEISPDIPECLMLDEARLRQVIINLVGNSVKFTQEGYIRIMVTADKQENDHLIPKLKISIEDSGRGIPENSLNTIFEEFEQVGNQKNIKGSGLGLAICKRLVHLMNGTIEAKSIEGAGSTFTITLKDVEIVKNKLDKRISTEKEPLSIMFNKASVLIADDSEEIRDYIKEVLTMLNLNVFTADSGKSALEILESVSPDLILMDIKMPIMDGWEATRIIKSTKKLSSIPILAFTASIDDKSISKLTKYGFDSYLSKPVKIRNLSEELSKFLKYTDTSVEERLIEDNSELSYLIPAPIITSLKKIWPKINEDGSIIKLKDVETIITLLQDQDDQTSNVSQLALELGRLKSNYDIESIEKLLKKISLHNNL